MAGLPYLSLLFIVRRGLSTTSQGLLELEHHQQAELPCSAPHPAVAWQGPTAAASVLYCCQPAICDT